jgi:LPXTG-motif cell wall-anchored protein
MLFALPGLSTSSVADVNTDIAVGDLRLTKIDAAENEESGQLIAGSSLALLTFTWDATNATVKAGDSFSIDLPTPYLVYKTRATKPFTYDFGAGEVEIGECVIGETNMTCTFNEAMEQAVVAGYGNVKGSGKVQLSATAATTDESLPFTINGTETVEVDLPDSGGIRAAATVSYTPAQLTKGATGMDEYSKTVNWIVGFGTERIAENSDMTFDGETSQTITIEDMLGPGMSCPTDAQVNSSQFRSGTSESDPTAGAVTLDTGSVGATTTAAGTFELVMSCGTPTASGTPITISITGPFAKNANYSVYYTVSVDTASGYATAGFIYTNTVTVEGTPLTVTGTKSFVESFGITVTMEAGFGTFRIAKYVGGPAATYVEPGAIFPVTVNYTLPTGATAADYPRWTPPGTLNSDNRTGTATFNVTLGELTTFTESFFPAGTRITLAEDLSSVALSDGYSWADPTFSTNDFTIGNQTITAVNLTNTTQFDPSYFQVVKKTSGSAAAEDKDYTFNYTCTDGHSGTVTARGDGVAVSSEKNIAVGASCTVTEDTDAAAIDGYTLDTTAAQPQTVTIAAPGDAVATAEFSNVYSLDTGTFSITKRLNADDGFVAPEAFVFDYTCTASGREDLTGELTASAGETATSPAIPVGYSCSVTEQEARAPGYDLTVDNGATVTIAKGEDQSIVVTNTYTRQLGTFAVKKAVIGDYTPSAGETFAVTYTCDDQNQTRGTLTLPADGTAVSGPSLPTGTSCVLQEDQAAADREGYGLATTYSDGAVTIVEGQNPELTVTNNYTALKGSFAISKTVAGDAADLANGKEFTFEYTCTPRSGADQFTDTVTVKAGETASVRDVPVGTCQVKELDASVSDAAVETMLTVDGSAEPVADGVATVEVSDNSTVEVSAVNTYTHDRGTFAVVKNVVGGESGFATEIFPFDYECSDGSQGSLAVPGDGTAVSSPTIPTGVTCTVAEREGAADRSGYTVVAEISDGGAATIVKDTDVVLTATNTYTVVPPATPTQEQSMNPTASTSPSASAAASASPTAKGTAASKSRLPKTGASVTVPVIVGIAAVLIGVLLVLAKRRGGKE